MESNQAIARDNEPDTEPAGSEVHPEYDPDAKLWRVDGKKAPSLRALQAKLPPDAVIKDYYPDGYGANRGRGYGGVSRVVYPAKVKIRRLKLVEPPPPPPRTPPPPPRAPVEPVKRLRPRLPPGAKPKPRGDRGKVKSTRRPGDRRIAWNTVVSAAHDCSSVNDVARKVGMSAPGVRYVLEKSLQKEVVPAEKVKLTEVLREAKHFPWTAVSQSELIHLALQGRMSGSQIATLFTAKYGVPVSRSAVIAKAGKLGAPLKSARNGTNRLK